MALIQVSEIWYFAQIVYLRNYIKIFSISMRLTNKQGGTTFNSIAGPGRQTLPGEVCGWAQGGGIFRRNAEAAWSTGGEGELKMFFLNWRRKLI